MLIEYQKGWQEFPIGPFNSQKAGTEITLQKELLHNTL